MLCATIGKCACTFKRRNPVCIQILRAYAGIGDAETRSPGGCVKPIHGGMRKPNPRGMRKHHPRGCCGNPGIWLKYAQGQKSSKGLPRATHCTDRAQTSGNVTPRTELCPPPLMFRIKVRARRDVPRFFFDNYTYTYTKHTSPCPREFCTKWLR